MLLSTCIKRCSRFSRGAARTSRKFSKVLLVHEAEMRTSEKEEGLDRMHNNVGAGGR